MSGHLIVRPISATINIEDDSITQMRPFVIVKLGPNHKRTNTSINPGKEPSWNTELTFHREFEESIVFEVWNKGFVSDEFIGKGELLFESVEVRLNRYNDWIRLKNGGNTVGMLLCDVQFFPFITNPSKIGDVEAHLHTPVSIPETLQGEPHNHFHEEQPKYIPKPFPGPDHDKPLPMGVPNNYHQMEYNQKYMPRFLNDTYG